MAADPSVMAAAGWTQQPDGSWAPSNEPLPDATPAPAASTTAPAPAASGAAPAPAAVPAAPPGPRTPSPYQPVPLHQAPDGAWTTLSDADYADLQARSKADQARAAQQQIALPPGQKPVPGAVTVQTTSPIVAQPSAAAPPPTPQEETMLQAGWTKNPDGSWSASPQPTAPAPVAPGAPQTATGQSATPALGPGPPPPTTPQIPGIAPPKSADQAAMRDQPWYQGLLHGTASMIDNLPRELTHGMTLGFDDLVEPILPSLFDAAVNGIPFEQAYAQNKAQYQQQRQPFESQHPWVSGVTQMAGSAIPALAASPLYGAARAGAPLLMRGITAVRNLAVDAGLGGLGGFGMTEGDLQQRLAGARQGAELSGFLGRVMPFLGRIGGGIWRSLRPSSQVDTMAGKSLLEATGGRVPTPEQAPIPNFPLDTGSATNEPGLSALVRRSDTTNDAAAVARRTQQATAIREAATETQPGGTRLANSVTPQEASSNVVRNVRNANEVIKREEERLWQKPSIQKFSPDMPALKKAVDKAITAMPARFQNAINRTPALRDALEDLANLPNNATLADVNSIRSELLGLSRDLAATGDNYGAKVADMAASSILKGVESNPALRNNPQAWNDYVRARNFTKSKWDVMGHDAIQNILKPNRWGQQGIDERNAAGTLINATGKNVGERVQGGIDAINQKLDEIRKTWGQMRNAGQTKPGEFDPVDAFNAKADMAQSARDYIVNSILDATSSSVRGADDQALVQLNALSKMMDRNRAWLQKSGLMNADQMALWDRIRDAAVMGARVENQRGGLGSPTYERIFGKTPKIIDLFASRYTKMGAAGVGALIGSMFGTWGDAGIGALLGVGAENMGHAILERLYTVPNEMLKAKLAEALQNPDIAADLMKNATLAASKSISPATRAWFRSLLAIEPTSQAARIFSPSLAPATP